MSKIIIMRDPEVEMREGSEGLRPRRFWSTPGRRRGRGCTTGLPRQRSGWAGGLLSGGTGGGGGGTRCCQGAWQVETQRPVTGGSTGQWERTGPRGWRWWSPVWWGERRVGRRGAAGQMRVERKRSQRWLERNYPSVRVKGCWGENGEMAGRGRSYSSL